MKRKELQLNMHIMKMNVHRQLFGSASQDFGGPGPSGWVDHSLLRYIIWGSTAANFTMLMNVWNILIVRMQNIDYENHKSVTRAAQDMLLVDRHRVLYKGLLAQSFGYTVLYGFQDVMHIWRTPESISSHFVWPFMFVLGTLACHPIILVSLNVQTSMAHKTKGSHMNTLRCFLDIRRN